MGYFCMPLDSVEPLFPDVVLPPSPSLPLLANLLPFPAIRPFTADMGHRLALGIAL
jgi:hypothetical protein